MKKLIVMLGVAALAATSQAAAIKWGGDICESDGATAYNAGSVAYLIHGTTEAAAAVTTVFVTGTDYTAWTTDTGASLVASYTLSALDVGTNYSFARLKDITGAADEGYYSVVVVNGQAGAVGLTGSYNYAGQNTLVDPTSGSITDLTISDGWVSKWIGNGGGDAVTFAAPEPTSGLLFLLGMAGLALKRKRA